jgi:hypothetical protein
MHKPCISFFSFVDAGAGSGQPPLSSAPAAATAAAPAAQQQQADPAAAATLARLRQLGVSFISPEDLRPAQPPPPPSQGPVNHPYNSIFLPRAAATTSLWSDAGVSPDTSLEMNSLALKYLDDVQLSKLAEQHRINSSNSRQRRASFIDIL